MLQSIPDRSRINLVVAPISEFDEEKGGGQAPDVDPKAAALAKIEGPENPEPVEPCLADVRTVLESLEKNTPLTQVAAQGFGDTAFGIGHMIHHARRKTMICPSLKAEELVEKLCSRMLEISEKGFASRILAIRALRDIHLVDAGIPDRTLKPAGTTPCIRSIAVLMEEIRKIPFDTVISASRGKDAVGARFETIWVMRHVCGHSLTVIGRNVGGRDHTTVLNSLNKMNLEKNRDAGKTTSLSNLCERADLIGIQKNRRILARQATLND